MSLLHLVLNCKVFTIEFYSPSISAFPIFTWLVAQITTVSALPYTVMDKIWIKMCNC